MKFFARKTGTGFEFATEFDGDLCSSIGIGSLVELESKRPRCVKFNQKYFVLINLAFRNQDKYDNIEHFRWEVQLKAGHFDAHITTKGETLYFPRSVSFANMDEDEFAKLYNEVIDVILKHFLTGSTKEEIDKQVLQILDFS